VNFYALQEFIRSKFIDILGSLSYMLSIAEDVLLVSFRGAFDLPNNDIYCLISALGIGLVAVGIGEWYSLCQLTLSSKIKRSLRTMEFLVLN
jgi:hypothetical protein